MRVGRHGALALLVLVLAGPASASDAEGGLDAVNRKTRSFNFWLLDHVVEPIARGYNFAMPKWGQERVRNLIENLGRPRDAVNSLLQGKPARAGRHAAALLIDSTVGVAGLFTPSERWIEPESPETTGETLGTWGIPAGSFVILPLYGESCPRCLLGAVGDAVLNPLFWIPGAAGSAATGGRAALDGINALARQMPRPFADDSEWKAFEERLQKRHDYPEAKRLFFENLDLDVAD
jgi:phospholipid-binding lipoprotein MlaA